MFIDARSLPDHAVAETDVCIAGAGAAGITLAREFIGSGLRVSVLESGGLDHDEEAQDLARGEVVGQRYFPLELIQCRSFGGTTRVWSGLCRPLDRIDFEPRDGFPHSGWPFPRSHLEPFYERAHPILQLGPFDYRPGAWEERATRGWPFVGGRVRTALYQLSPQTRFGEVYRDELGRAANVHVILHATVTEIETDGSGRTVTRLRTATLEGKVLKVSARYFVLAMGGIETPRLLLLSNRSQAAGLGNAHDLVGRFFMEHPHLESGAILPSNPRIGAGFYGRHSVNGTRVFGALALGEETLRRERMLNLSASLSFTKGERYEVARRSEGASSFRSLYLSLRRGEIPGDLLGHLARVVADIDDVALDVYGEVFEEDIPLFGLYNRMEQSPDPGSRVTLSREKDRLGTNRARLDWRLGASDRESLRRGQTIIGEDLGHSGLGRLRMDLDGTGSGWPETVTGGGHLMGTTRMHVDPRRGVVDEHCRVHGISNLYISGPSVFPTVGCANPMLTTVALALRLADHLKEVVR